VASRRRLRRRGDDHLPRRPGLKLTARPTVVVAMRRFVPIALAALAMAALVSHPAAASVSPGRLGVGDSIMRSAADELAELDVAVRAKVGRQFDEGLRVVRRLEASGALPRLVIVHLGTNGWIDRADCDAVVETAGSGRRVFLVTVRVPRHWMRPNNDVLRSCAAAYERAHVIRWSMIGGRHPEWFADDGYHLNAEGQQRYARYLDRSVDAILATVRAS